MGSLATYQIEPEDHARPVVGAGELDRLRPRARDGNCAAERGRADAFGARGLVDENTVARVVETRCHLIDRHAHAAALSSAMTLRNELCDGMAGSAVGHILCEV